MGALTRLFLTFTVFALLAMSPDIAEAGNHCGQEDCGGGGPGGGGGGNGGGDSGSPWMHEDVGVAHDDGWVGDGSHMIILDSFSGTLYSGNLDGTSQSLTHGEWTSFETQLVAPGATFENLAHPLNNTGSITGYYASTTGVDVVNLSFGWVDQAGQDPNDILGAFYGSLASEAVAGNAVFVKAAGNTNGLAVDASFATVLDGQIVTVQDYLNLGLIGAEGALFVGALSKNGSTKKKASIARYSTIAGDNLVAQDMFLVVGVDSGKNGGLEGTSFAAPIVTGYAAILGQKFEAATPALIVDQLLDTARTDTIRSYNEAVHGQGEASLFNALAPVSIN